MTLFIRFTLFTPIFSLVQKMDEKNNNIRKRLDYDDKLSSKCFTSIVNPSKTLANRSRISYNPLLELRMLVTIFKNFLEELKQRRRLNNFRWCCLCFFLFEFSPFHVIFASVFFRRYEFMTFPSVLKNTSDCVYLLIGSPFLLTERKLLSPMQGKNNYCTCCYYLLL